MLALDGILITCYVIIGVTFVDVDVAEGYDLWWRNISGVSKLVGMEVYL
jgi:hypothetical protein